MNFLFKTILVSFLLILFFIFFTSCWLAQRYLLLRYYRLESQKVFDREGKLIALLPNEKGNFAYYLDNIPKNIRDFLIKKEDKYFYYHFGINPVSTFKAALGYFNLGPKRASSTITQQLVKILLGKEFERNLKNKIIEAFYALSLEMFQSKNDILKMYANSVYLGNSIQGIGQASLAYFDVSPQLLGEGQILQILATISSPTEQNPAKEKNIEIAKNLAKKLDQRELVFISPEIAKQNLRQNLIFDESFFETQGFIEENLKEIHFTIDKELNRKVRKIVKANLDYLKERGAKNSAVIVILIPENEILAMVGSPDPYSFKDGSQINMLFKPRAVGSTIKPFIYLKAFEKGLRPYTLVEDREYRYATALGFPLYPRNFDLKYRGLVNLHYALANSLNVPTVKVLEYLGIENFVNFFEKELQFVPIQDWENYQLGIALGGLEMSLWDLAKFFTIFPNNGVFKEVTILKNKSISEGTILVQKEYIQLINKILSDRKTAIDQFGLTSNLNLPYQNYALKTGTSRDFLDSWIIGFTPDFLVGVWVGNADNTPMDAVSGQEGAGKIWSQIMELLFNSKYNKKSFFEFNLIEERETNGVVEYGLRGDNYEKIKRILIEQDKNLILNPHHRDVFLYEKESKIILRAREEASWFVNNVFLAKAKETLFSLPHPGYFQIRAKSSTGFEEEISIEIK